MRRFSGESMKTKRLIYERGSTGNGHSLFRDGKRVPLTPKAVDILISLVESRGNPVGTEE